MIPELPELPVFPARQGDPDQPKAFFDKFFAFLEALRLWADAINELTALLNVTPTETTTTSITSLALTIDTVEDTTYHLGADHWHHKRFTSSLAVTLTVDTDHGMSPGERVRFTQVGAGQVTMVPVSGMILNSRNSALKSTGRYSIWELECISIDQFDVLGDVSVT